MSQVLIPPTVGRVVWFHPAANGAEAGFAPPAAGTPLAAIVARVWSDTCVNLTVFDANGAPHSRTSVLLVQDGQPAPDGYYCEWMPFQKGQAKAQAAVAAPAPATDSAIEQEIQAKGKTAARVTPADIEANISSEVSFVVGDVLQGPVSASTKLLTICVLTLQNGFTVTGESACASPDNFDAEIGHKVARENAKQKIWPLMGYALKQRLHDLASGPV